MINQEMEVDNGIVHYADFEAELQKLKDLDEN
jgi:hypothetical protein